MTISVYPYDLFSVNPLKQVKLKRKNPITLGSHTFIWKYWSDAGYETAIVFATNGEVGLAEMDKKQTAARLVTHVSNKGEQLIRYYGFYSNKVRSVRKKAEASMQAIREETIPQRPYEDDYSQIPLMMMRRIGL